MGVCRGVVLLPLVGVPSALAGKGLVIPTEPCSRASPPYSLQVFGSVGGGATFGAPWRGSGRSGRYSGIRAQGSKEICNELITMSVPKKGTRALLARPCRVAVRWLAFQQGPSVSCRRVLLLLLGEHASCASSVVAVFARAMVGVRRRPAHPCGCIAKAERAYVWCGLHRCRAVACGSGRRCPCLVGCSPVVGVCPC
ncbi:hypothetical protein Taro_050908 [Colocasia esculenta]|uniref:Secreted protein n=1 Tax=Colocasia esculenta TaxID=4460 RepID=A0A843XFD2_COLES|nr:hypothetical protein [Colocasia esculenta]